MSDEKKIDPSAYERTWGHLPREIKAIVYETLREASAKYTRDAAQAAIMKRLALGGASGVSVLEETTLLIAEGFDIAIGELEIGDPEICPDCGGYHDPEEPTVHKKDLS